MKRFVLAIFCLTALIGCGGPIDEVPPATEGPEEMSQEEQQKIIQESMQKGNAGKRYQPPGQ